MDRTPRNSMRLPYIVSLWRVPKLVKCRLFCRFAATSVNYLLPYSVIFLRFNQWMYKRKMIISPLLTLICLLYYIISSFIDPRNSSFLSPRIALILMKTSSRAFSNWSTGYFVARRTRDELQTTTEWWTWYPLCNETLRCSCCTNQNYLHFAQHQSLPLWIHTPMDCQHAGLHEDTERKVPSDSCPRAPGCWCIPLSCTGLPQYNPWCWSPWSFRGGSLWNRCRESGSCMLLASGWSLPAVISFGPNSIGTDSSFGRSRSLAR